MLRTKHLMNVTSEALKRLWGALAVLLMLVGTMGCTHGPQKRKVEIWLIDGDTDVLYRRVSETYEDAIPISGNSRAMDRFMCIDRSEADYWIEELVE